MLIFGAGKGEAASAAAARGSSVDAGSLLELASKLFPRLTRAERTLLEWADVKNVGRGLYPVVAETSADYESETVTRLPEDPSNDPKDAANWDGQREIRASLIQWLCEDAEAIRLINPQGIKVLGAKIVGTLNLSEVKVPFPITLRRCWITELMDLSDAEIPGLDLNGSYTGPIRANDIDVANAVRLGLGFHAKGKVDLQAANLGSIAAVDGHFQWAPDPGDVFQSFKVALNLRSAKIAGDVSLACESRGGISLNQARIGGNLFIISSHLINPQNTALDAAGADITGNLFLVSAAQLKVTKGGDVLIDGVADFGGTQVGALFYVGQTRFMGSADQPHGFRGPAMVVKGPFFWFDVALENDAQLDLSGASVGALVDQEPSWPAPGKLLIDQFTYSRFGQSQWVTPVDAHTRLQWIRLQPPGFYPQPYRQLAKVLRENGDEAGAIRVLIAGEDERYRQYGWAGAILGGFLKKTIGYGHRPMLTVLWMLGVVAMGWVMVAIGKRAGVMRPTWPESIPAVEEVTHERLHPLLYSFDVFLPFVNFHQEHYWWPNAGRTGEYSIFGRRIRFSGSLLRYYLWAQITAGWLLSAIFVAGVTGLIRND